MKVEALAGYRKQVSAAWSEATAAPGWDATPGSPVGQCGVTSAWLQERLKADHGIDTTFHVGNVDIDGQVFRDHCWLEADGVVIDLTGDQFGLPEVVYGAPEGVLYQTSSYLLQRAYAPTNRLAVLKALLAGWKGHRDLCSLQWSPDICDCDPDNPIDFSEVEECRPIIAGGSLWNEESMHAARRHRTEDQAEDAKFDAESTWCRDMREVW